MDGADGQGGGGSSPTETMWPSQNGFMLYPMVMVGMRHAPAPPMAAPLNGSLLVLPHAVLFISYPHRKPWSHAVTAQYVSCGWHVPDGLYLLIRAPPYANAYMVSDGLLLSSLTMENNGSYGRDGIMTFMRNDATTPGKYPDTCPSHVALVPGGYSAMEWSRPHHNPIFEFSDGSPMGVNENEMLAMYIELLA